MTYTRLKNRAISVTGDGFPTDDFKSVSSAATISGGTGTFTNWAQVSYFARATYSYDNKYLTFWTKGNDNKFSNLNLVELNGNFPLENYFDFEYCFVCIYLLFMIKIALIRNY